MLVRIKNYDPQFNGKYARLVSKDGGYRNVEFYHGGDLLGAELLETEVETMIYDVVNWEQVAFENQESLLERLINQRNFKLLDITFGSTHFNFVVKHQNSTLDRSGDILEFLDWTQKLGSGNEMERK